MKQENEIQIREGSIYEAVTISSYIPEFKEPYNIAEYEQRFKNKKYLIAVALVNNQYAGFKVAYQSDSAQQLYSWMGGVVPRFRQNGVAKQLAEYQEFWARNNSFSEIAFKTRNYYKAMIIFALKNGFQITSVEQKNDPQENRIYFTKQIL